MKRNLSLVIILLVFCVGSSQAANLKHLTAKPLKNGVALDCDSPPSGPASFE